MTLRRTLRTVWLLWTVQLFASCLSAQTPIPPSSLKGKLLDLSARTNTIALGTPQMPADDVTDLDVLVGLEVSTAPFGTSTGSFTFTFDNQAGTFRRSTQSFGPVFGKRSLTIGERKLSVGFNWLHANYDSNAGLDLKNGDYRPVKNARTTDGSPLPLPYASSGVKLNITSDTYVGFASFGLTDSLDVGVAVPWVRISLGADVGLFSPDGVDLTPGGHQLVLPDSSAAGVGDIALFAKYRLMRRGEGGLAGEVEVRLPSGDTNELRGAGVTRTLVSAIWSLGGTVSPHANVGYEFWSSSVPLGPEISARNQVNYAFGLELKAHPRATAVIDVVGRRLLGGGKSGYVTLTVGTLSLDVLSAVPEALDVVSFAPGVKWNVAGNVLLTANVLASIVNQGLRANVVPVVGLDWAF